MLRIEQHQRLTRSNFEGGFRLGAGAAGVINTAHCNAYREVEQRLRQGSDHSSLATQSLNESQRA